jgi:hypothetical protein
MTAPPHYGKVYRKLPPMASFFARQAEKKSAILVVFDERGLYNNSVPGKWGQNVKVK